MSTVQHGVAVSRPFVRSMFSIDDIRNLRCRECRVIEQTKAERTYSKEKVTEAMLQSAWGNKSGHRKLIEHGKQTLKILLLLC